MTTSTTAEVGRKAPAFTLPDQDEIKVKLTDYTGQWVVLYFYPRDNTPGCTTEACDFSDSLRSFEELNAVILGVSPDSPASHEKFIAKHSLKIRLLADTERKVLEKYGAFGPKKMYGKETMGVIRSTFLIDPNGKVAHAWRNVKAKGHVARVQEKLAELTG